ncbi:MAG: putative intracellular protease/amidase [Algoriphagus sp.]|jgi:putative intracellular protease/amidase
MKVLILASNVGLWGEELQAPWDILKSAGFELTLATPKGITPLPLILSVDKNFIDPMQNYNVNPSDVVDRIIQILDEGEWDNPIKIADANMDDYDALVLVGGPGSPLDLVGNPYVHQLCLKAWQSDKILGALCYAVGAFVWSRDTDPMHRSIIYGKQIVAHPRKWDFTGELNYPLFRATENNRGTDLVTQGFVFPLAVIVEDAVGPKGKVHSNPEANRNNPQVVFDYPFVTALSVESSIAFSHQLVHVLLNEINK